MSNMQVLALLVALFATNVVANDAIVEGSALDTAVKFFKVIESGAGKEACAPFMVEDASFHCDALPQYVTIGEYCDFMKGLISGPIPDFSYKLHSIQENTTPTITFVARWSGTNTGEGGPVDPTGKHTVADYTYSFTFDKYGKVSKMLKVFDIYTAFKGLGWPLPSGDDSQASALSDNQGLSEPLSSTFDLLGDDNALLKTHPNLNVAYKFFDVVESGAGAAGCRAYLKKNAKFSCDAFPDIHTVEDYCDTMAGLVHGPVPNFHYSLISVGWNTDTVTFVARFTATNTGEGGPVPKPTGKSCDAMYTYSFTFGDNGKIVSMYKVFDIFTAFSQLGWPLA